MTRLSHFTDVWFYFTAQREREVVKEKEGKRQGKWEKPSERDISPCWHRTCMHMQIHVEYTSYLCVCVFIYWLCVPHISVMVSGRFVGISVSPFPLQSTMLLLQVHDSGHCNTLQEEDDDDWWPRQTKRSDIIHDNLKAVRIHWKQFCRCAWGILPLMMIWPCPFIYYCDLQEIWSVHISVKAKWCTWRWTLAFVIILKSISKRQ